MAPAGTCRIRGGWPRPVVNPSFQLRSPSSKASSRAIVVVGAAAAVNSWRQVVVVMVTPFLLSGISGKRNNHDLLFTKYIVSCFNRYDHLLWRCLGAA